MRRRCLAVRSHKGAWWFHTVASSSLKQRCLVAMEHLPFPRKPTTFSPCPQTADAVPQALLGAPAPPSSSRSVPSFTTSPAWHHLGPCPAACWRTEGGWQGLQSPPSPQPTSRAPRQPHRGSRRRSDQAAHPFPLLAVRHPSSGRMTLPLPKLAAFFLLLSPLPSSFWLSDELYAKSICSCLP